MYLYIIQAIPNRKVSNKVSRTNNEPITIINTIIRVSHRRRKKLDICTSVI